MVEYHRLSFSRQIWRELGGELNNPILGLLPISSPTAKMKAVQAGGKEADNAHVTCGMVPACDT
jgi:hypothetical protein